VNVCRGGDVQAVALAASNFPASLQGPALEVTEIGEIGEAAGQAVGDLARHLDSDRARSVVAGVWGLLGPAG
jgi:hypothetical protein